MNGQFQGLKEIHWWVLFQVAKICIIRSPSINCLSRPSIYTTVLNNKSLFKDKSALWLTIRLKIARPLCVCGIAHREFMSIFHTLQFDEIFFHSLFFSSLLHLLISILFQSYEFFMQFYVHAKRLHHLCTRFDAVFINSII